LTPTSHNNLWQRIARRTQHGDTLFQGLVLLFALTLIVMIGIILFVTLRDSALSRETYHLGFLFEDGWNSSPTEKRPEIYGALPAIYGTLTTSLIAVVLAAPIGIGAGVFLSELCPGWLKRPLALLIELLAAIPSVIYGLWGYLIFIPQFHTFFATPVSQTFGQIIPFLKAPQSAGTGIMVTGFVLGIMILPTIAAITHDVVKVVPQSQRQVLYSLGATRWETIWLGVLPYAFAGIVGGVMLGLGRALGETMAAIMLIGNSIAINETLFDSGTTSAALIANQLISADRDLHESSLIYLALLLFLITFIVNLFARILVWYIARKQS
jgi:phosphate transport system permease protein